MQSRRSFIHDCTAAAVGLALLRADALARARSAVASVAGKSPLETASDEDFWIQIQQAYDIDRSIINLNNGGVAPTIRAALDAERRHIELINTVPPRQLWTVLDPQVETVRIRLARAFGCDPEELAITRNASESLQICLFGLDLKAGDEVLTTTHDYPRMINTLKQREQREGIVLKTFSFPTPLENPRELVRLFEQNITDRTRVILVCHITNLTGQIFPIRDIVALARSRGIDVIVDGAHAFGHFRFTRDELDCDYYGTSLHKWLSAPIGTGFLYVRKEKIAKLWPLMAAPDPHADNIRKFEEIGTHPTACRLAIAEALTLHEAIGIERKEARLRYLREYWAKSLSAEPRVRLFSSLDPVQSCGIGTVGVEGIPSNELSDTLWKKHRIVVTPIPAEFVDGVRVTANTYTTLRELDMFIDAMRRIIRDSATH